MTRILSAGFALALLAGTASVAAAGEGSIDSRNFGPSYWPYNNAFTDPGYTVGGVVVGPSSGYAYRTPGVVYDDDMMTGYAPRRAIIDADPSVDAGDVD